MTSDLVGDDEVRGYYDTAARREAHRLSTPDDGTIELALHARAFEEHLPPSPTRVLDLGGGPGTWSLWLAERGYQVTLGDLSPALLTIARERIGEADPDVAARVEAVDEVDARGLSRYPDDSFDAVLCLGPFYHLDAGGRDQAANELRRVLRPGGVLAVALMPRYMRLVSTVLERGSEAFDSGLVSRIVECGAYDDERPGRFTGARLVRPEDVVEFFASHGFTTRRLMASQGVLGWVQGDVAALAERDPDAHRRLLDIAYETADDPSVLGMAGHLLYVGTNNDA
ncbi:class I SAM-dependent methyltransferase [Luteimicrobium sp. DT211]|uniref:class I SAM-dependent methyltransferase n=1 Tax=Luteimicrobium sp. DT211 TaxID=3393412 RepID=UPI003CEB532E